jgi:hypothetical protein
VLRVKQRSGNRVINRDSGTIDVLGYYDER